MSLRSAVAAFFTNLIGPGSSRAARGSDLRLSVAETEDTITTGQRYGASLRDNQKRSTIISEALTAWRTNPIAKRICELQTEFAIGDGLGFESQDETVKAQIADVWNHPLNNLDEQLPQFAGEGYRTGDLFIIGRVEKATARVYYRALPSENVAEIETVPNDYRQEKKYKSGQLDEKPYLAYDPQKDYLGEDNEFVLHFPLNPAVGSCFGESDFATILYWIKLYRQFIEDRARLNFFRQLFTFVLQKTFNGSQEEKDSYVKDFGDRLPKKSGGVLALDEDEVLGTINPNLGSFEAGEDGMLIVRMIAIGVGFPLHWLGFAESNTRTTAEAAGTPAFRRLKTRQKFIVYAAQRMIEVALEIKHKADPDQKLEKVQFSITAPDLTERDNEKLALAVLRLTQAMAPVYNAKKISVKEFLRLLYRFLGETRPADEPAPGDDPIILSGKGNTDNPNPTPSQEPA